VPDGSGYCSPSLVKAVAISWPLVKPQLRDYVLQMLRIGLAALLIFSALPAVAADSDDYAACLLGNALVRFYWEQSDMADAFEQSVVACAALETADAADVQDAVIHLIDNQLSPALVLRDEAAAPGYTLTPPENAF
jgi:hypothetical protein